MHTRLNHNQASPEAIRAQLGLSQYVGRCGLEHSLLELVKIRASQINRCGYCLDMHTHEVRAAGETEQRLHVLAAWEESPLFSERERAALAWTEAITQVSTAGVPDALFARVRPHFTDRELVDLTLAVSVINTWNRLAIAFRPVHPIRAGTPAEARSTAAAAATTSAAA